MKVKMNLFYDFYVFHVFYTMNLLAVAIFLIINIFSVQYYFHLNSLPTKDRPMIIILQTSFMYAALNKF